MIADEFITRRRIGLRAQHELPPSQQREYGAGVIYYLMIRHGGGKQHYGNYAYLCACASGENL